MSHIRIEESLRLVLAKDDAYVPRRTDMHAFASEAGSCLRAVGYRLMGPQQRDQLGYSTQTLIAFRVGRIIHEVVEQAIVRSRLNAQVEVAWDKGLVSGRADATYFTAAGAKVVVEIKTMNPTSFNRSAAAGEPTRENHLQAALSAFALQASYQHLIYLNKAPRSGDDTVAEWFYKSDRNDALVEFYRLEQAVKLVKAGFLPPRETWSGEIEEPSASVWPCKWCSYKEECVAAGPGPVPLQSPLTA